jgi:hypothetical protein
MAFSLSAALLRQPTLSMLAGSGCISLVGRIARRLLPYSNGRPRT